MLGAAPLMHPSFSSPRSLRFERSVSFLTGGVANQLERYPAEWTPVRVKKTRQIKNLEPRSDFIGTEKALGEQPPTDVDEIVRLARQQTKQDQPDQQQEVPVDRAKLHAQAHLGISA